MKRDRIFFQLFVFGLCMIGFFAPLRNYVSHIFMGFSGLFWLLTFRKERLQQDAKTLNTFFIFISLYLIQVVGLAYSDNLEYGIFLLDTKLSLIALPILILLSPIRVIDIYLIFRVFIAGTLVACVWCQWEALKTLNEVGDTWIKLITNERYQNQSFTQPIPVHPAYLSLSLAISTFFIAEVELPRKRFKGWWIALIIAFTYFQFILMSRAAIAAFGAAVLFYVFYKTIYLQRRYLLGGLITGFFFAAVAVFLIYVPEFRIRMVDTMININERLHDIHDPTSTSLHIKQWYCAWTSINGTDLLLGFGTGDEIDVLLKCYQKQGYSVLYERQLDAHNEYLSSLLRHGVIGVGLFLFNLVYAVWLGFRGRNMLYIVFTIMVAIHAIAASILYGQTSLVIFALFNSLLAKETLISRGFFKSEHLY